MKTILHNNVARRSSGLKIAALFVALAFAGCSVGPVKGPESTGLSGHEVFNGNRAGNVVTGAIFAGADNKVCDCWTNDNGGGTWSTSINYRGQGGLGSSVTVTGGRWSWLRADGVIRSGRIVDGQVTWPSTLDSNAMGCGSGVARFAVTLSLAGQSGGGTIKGCLDDSHLDPRQQPFVFPPKLWGTLTLERN